MTYTIGDFSGKIFGQDKAVNICNMKCEMTLNETDMVNVEKSNSTKYPGFQIKSNLFTVKHGNQVYNFNGGLNYITDGITHNGLFENTFGVVSELVLHASRGFNGKQLYIYIPIYKSFNLNANGKLLKSINEQTDVKEHNISDLFPKNISFYTYSSDNETSVVFINSNIMIKDSEDLVNLSRKAGSLGIEGKIRNKDADASGYKYFFNKKGITEGGNETTIIDCQPIDDDGMLLEDREKGLNQTGISQTSSLEVIGDKIMENPLAQTAIGIILLYILTKILRSGQTFFPQLNAN